MFDFEIKKGRPNKRSDVRSSKYPWPKMVPGTYIEVPAKLIDVRKGKKYCSVVSSALSFGRRHGMKFVSQQQDSGAIRIFRVK